MRARQLAESSLVASARIMKIDQRCPSCEQIANYSYEAGGTSYKGSTQFAGIDAERGRFQIKYLPSDPGYSAVDPLRNIGLAELQIMTILEWLAIVLAAATFMWVRFLRGNKTS